MKYAIVEISGKQYKVTPKTVLSVDSLGEDQKSLECDKVLLMADEKDLKVGTPYLKEKLTFEVVKTLRERKIRVATFHAKANTRKVKGSRRHISRIKLQEGS